MGKLERASLASLSFLEMELGDGRWEKEGEDLSGSFSSVSCLLSLGSVSGEGGGGGEGLPLFSVLVLSGRLFFLDFSLASLLAAFWITVEWVRVSKAFSLCPDLLLFLFPRLR